MIVLGKDLQVGDTHFYHEEEQWTVSENPRPREGHESGYGLSLQVEKPNGTALRISIGREEPFLIERGKSLRTSTPARESSSAPDATPSTPTRRSTKEA